MNKGGRRFRVMWLLNHSALIDVEVPLLRELGAEVYVPKVLPGHIDFRSGTVDFSLNDHLTLDPSLLAALDQFDFYEGDWTPSQAYLINKHFDAIILTLSYNEMTFQALHWFDGPVFGRAFGLEGDLTYARLLEPQTRRLIEERDFTFCQAYDQLREVEPPAIANRSETVGLCISQWATEAADSWTGGLGVAMFLCPDIGVSPYYENAYRGIVADFHDLPRIIVGRQPVDPHDSSAIGFVETPRLVDVMQTTSAFVYPQREMRHLHYSPLEAMTIGTPVLFLAESLLGRITPAAAVGRCSDEGEMLQKARRLIQGDADLASRIRDAQPKILSQFQRRRVLAQWKTALKLEPTATQSGVLEE